MTDQPFTPHADSIQTAWVLMCQQSRVSTQPPVEELEAEFDRFIAKVKRAAARDALSGLEREAAGAAGGNDENTSAGVCRAVQGWAEEYRDHNYPRGRDPVNIMPDTWSSEVEDLHAQVARLKAQSETRRQQTVYWKERAEGFEAKMNELDRAYISEHGQRRRAEDEQDRLKDKLARRSETVSRLLEERNNAEARIQAVRDVLAHHPYGGPDQEDAIRRALTTEETP